MLLEFLLILALVVSTRAYVVIKRPNAKADRKGLRRTEPCTVGVFLGSGGHTTEALTLLSTLDPSRYPVRKYLVSSGDSMSCEKALAFEAKNAPQQDSASPRYAIVVLPRARKVHQSLLTTPPTFLYSLLVALWHITLAPALHGTPFSDVLLLNGPGTCVVVATCVWIGRFLGMKTPRIIYVESFARVTRLSLSGKILKHCVDRFIVQWPELLTSSRTKGEYRGWLV